MNINADVFISYHTKTCKDLAEMIAAILSKHNVSCFFAGRDITHDVYAGQIFNAIRNCKVFLLLLNREASESYDVINEINLMAQRVRHGDIFSRFILQLERWTDATN